MLFQLPVYKSRSKKIETLDLKKNKRKKKYCFGKLKHFYSVIDFGNTMSILSIVVFLLISVVKN